MSRFDKILFPPNSVHEMLTLDRSKFTKSVQIPFVSVPVKCIDKIRGLPAVRELSLERMPRLKALYASPNCERTERLLLFDPDKFGESSEEEKNALANELSKLIDLSPKFGKMPYTFEYEDWDLRRCIQSVLPDGVDFGAFEQCGHIIHLNLRERVHPFRFTIGNILLDKLPSARTVVNKVNSLTDEFRVMDVELVAGEAEFKTEVVEHGIRYRLDYSKARHNSSITFVFWNSRLSRVHLQTVDKFDNHSVVFDAFAGVGPFILPAVKKRKVEMAFANDLNPESINYMRESIRLNGIPEGRIETYVMDGGEFIRNVIPAKVAEFCRKLQNEYSLNETSQCDVGSLALNFHAVMNLPGFSAQFLPKFRSFLSDYVEVRDVFENCHFWIHCHFFVKGVGDSEMDWYREDARRIVSESMEIANLDCLKELEFMRWVSSCKAMFCARILLPSNYAFGGDKMAGEKGKSAKRPPVENCAASNEGGDQRTAKERRIEFD
uniref:tRNA (guanine(37)-N1)-methyltransferase n=1 Tax=Globodera pallida TaxID=36090 RepID=A0A183BK21_GLOPA